MAKMTKQEKNLLKNELLRRARSARISADFSREELENVLKC
jgi:hypothetical protein